MLIRTSSIAAVICVTALSLSSQSAGGSPANPLDRPPSQHPQHCVLYAPSVAKPPSAKNFPGVYPKYSIGGIDSTGCLSWPYNGVYPIVSGFFRGSYFRPGVVEFEYGTREVTEV